MDKNKINKIIDYYTNEIKINKIEKYVLKEEVFRIFINNRIDVDELTEILQFFNIKLPSSFYKLDKVEQKKYYCSYNYFVSTETDKLLIKRIFCNAYYYDLVEAARKSYLNTQKLLEYVGEIDNIPLLFYTMQHIKIDNVWSYKNKALIANFKNSPALLNYRVETLYDLYMLVLNYKPGLSFSAKIKEEIESLLIDKINYDPNYEKNEFYLDVERMLSWLYIKTNSITNDEALLLKKIGNTLKNRFLILPNEVLRHQDVIPFKGNGASLLKKVDQEKYIKGNQQFYKIFKQIINKYLKTDVSKYNYSGYLALFLCLQGGKDYE